MILNCIIPLLFLLYVRTNNPSMCKIPTRKLKIINWSNLSEHSRNKSQLGGQRYVALKWNLLDQTCVILFAVSPATINYLCILSVAKFLFFQYLSYHYLIRSSANSCRPQLSLTECFNVYAYISRASLARKQSAPILWECGTKGKFYFDPTRVWLCFIFNWNSSICTIRGLICLRILCLWG